jgi:murein L,D-transpeptidase YafK
LDAAIATGRRNWTLHSKKREEGGEVEAGVDREQKWWKPWEKAENPAAAAAEREKRENAERMKVLRDRYADREKVKSQEKIKARNAELAAAPKEAISDEEDEEELEKAGERKKDGGPIQWFWKKKKSDKYTEDPVVDAAKPDTANQDAAKPDAANMV